MSDRELTPGTPQTEFNTNPMTAFWGEAPQEEPPRKRGLRFSVEHLTASISGEADSLQDVRDALRIMLAELERM